MGLDVNPFSAHRRRYRLLVGLLIVSLVVFAGLIYTYTSKRQALLDTAWNQAAQQAREAAQSIDRTLNKLVPINIGISEDLTSGQLEKKDIVARLKRDKHAHPTVFGVGVAYIPFAYDPQIRLYAPLYVDRKDGPALVQIEDDYDYTEPGRDWYHLPLAEGPVWQEPHYGQASKAYLANFTTPFFERNLETGEIEPIGVVFTSMSLTQYQELAKSLGLGEKGYAFVLSKKGAFVSHPNPEYVTQNKTLVDWAKELGDPELEELGRAAVHGIRAFTERVDGTSGKTEWVFSEPIVSAGWSVGVVLYRDRLVQFEKLRNLKILLVLAAATTALLALAVYFKRRREPGKSDQPTQMPMAS